jgi:hypothetical protein
MILEPCLLATLVSLLDLHADSLMILGIGYIELDLCPEKEARILCEIDLRNW